MMGIRIGEGVRTAVSPSSQTDLAHNFEVERELAERLRIADSEARRALYAEVYDEYFRRARHANQGHPDVREVARQVRIVTKFLPAGGSYLEIGAGAGHLAAALALLGARVRAVEVSKVVSGQAGVEVLITDGVSVPVEERSVDVVYSNQVMEHLHPEDAAEQLENICSTLVDGGAYICITPNRLSGPHDISGLFGERVACGFHLKEYTIRELVAAMREAGFGRVTVFLALGGEVVAEVPGRLYGVLEVFLRWLPRTMRRRHPVLKLLNPGGLIARR